MDSFNLVPKSPIPGAHGEFTVGSGPNKIRALYLETKIRPGQDGAWANLLASQMVPWREVFDIEKVTFDELLQRDLNDSRVAHDLIPYLLGGEGNYARFFPPILAVLVPRNTAGTGIDKYYPSISDKGEYIEYGNIFDFHPPKGENPSALINFNSQKAAFIIVDGQHRAMAVLALHRQLTKTWKSNSYASYYAHLDISAEDVKNIELPVCIVFFPDLVEDNAFLKGQGVSLESVCRELFLVVNRTAQKVSQARELLLDDDDIAARMMRHTLSGFKDRTENVDSLARIYSFKYGDSEESGKAVVSGQLEYSSSVALHKIHCIASFGNADGFNIANPSDLTDGRYHRNPVRPVDILLGSDLEKWPGLSRKSGKTHSPHDIKNAVNHLAELNDCAIFALFDKFWPFMVHNSVLRKIRTRLNDADMKANPVQSKCYSIMFEGSGVKSVFEEHYDRLVSIKEDIEEEGKTVSDYIKNQLNDCKAVLKAIDNYQVQIKKERACDLFNLNFQKIYDENASHEVQKTVEEKSLSIFNTVSTQAFQIGYIVAICSLVELLPGDDVKYTDRKKLFQMATDIVIETLNNFFKPKTATKHESLNGLVAEKRTDAFNSNGSGLRGLLAMSVNELNEKQWPFFRYSIYEMMLSKFNRQCLCDWLNKIENDEIRSKWDKALLELAVKVKGVRSDYITKAITKHINNSEFQKHLDTTRAHMKGASKSEDEIATCIKETIDVETSKIESVAKEHIKSTLGDLNGPDQVAKGACSKASAQPTLEIPEGD